MMDISSEERKIIETAEHLRNLKIHPGWIIIENLAKNELEKLQRKILEAIDWENYIKIREEIRALKKVLGVIDNFIAESAYIREEIKEKDAERI